MLFADVLNLKTVIHNVEDEVGETNGSEGIFIHCFLSLIRLKHTSQQMIE